MSYPAEFPPLPRAYTSPEINQAYNMIAAAYDSSTASLRQDELDPLRLRIQSTQMRNTMIPTLQELVNKIDDVEWFNTSAAALGQIIFALERSTAVAEQRCVLV